MFRVAKEGHKTQARSTAYRGKDCPFFFSTQSLTSPHWAYVYAIGCCKGTGLGLSALESAES